MSRTSLTPSSVLLTSALSAVAVALGSSPWGPELSPVVRRRTRSHSSASPEDSPRPKEARCPVSP